MSTSRRDFIKAVGAGAVVLYSSDLIGDLLAQSPGRALQSKFKGLADIALGEAKRAGCSYADIRFTRTMNLQGVNVSASASGASETDTAAGRGRGGGGR